jgi:dephospho-CoA kinase
VETRIQRVLKRDKTTREAILKRMDAQWSDEKRTSKSDFVVENSTIENAKREVDQILKILKIKQKHT